MPERTQVFVSYNHKDKPWLERLQTHLKPLTRDGTLDLWDDTRILPGVKWRDEITAALAKAKIAVLFVSPDFLASDFIDKNELPPLLKAAEAEGLVILWALVGPCFWKRTPLADMQGVQPTDRPLNALSPAEADAALFHLAESVLEAYHRPR